MNSFVKQFFMYEEDVSYVLVFLIMLPRNQRLLFNNKDHVVTMKYSEAIWPFEAESQDCGLIRD